ncbi:MAG: hypothetical protein QM784_10220 [Polyangiaceae bacterium]
MRTYQLGLGLAVVSILTGVITVGLTHRRTALDIMAATRDTDARDERSTRREQRPTRAPPPLPSPRGVATATPHGTSSAAEDDAEPYAKLSDAELSSLVASLRLQAATLQDSFARLSVKHHETIRSGNTEATRRSLEELEGLTERRLALVARLTDAAFERTCRSLAGCDTKTRRAFSAAKE